MELSSGASRLLSILQSYARRSGRAFPFQNTLAAKMAISDRMVRYYLRELVDAGIIKTRKRQHSSAEYSLVENFRSDFRSDFRSAAPVLLVSEGELRVSRKPPQPETGHTVESLHPQPEFWLVSAAGRRDVNPAWSEWRDERERIARAKNPVAYARAIARGA